MIRFFDFFLRHSSFCQVFSLYSLFLSFCSVLRRSFFFLVFTSYSLFLFVLFGSVFLSFLVWSTYWLLVSVSPGIFAKPTWQITPWPTNLVACLSKGRSTAIARAVPTTVFRAVVPNVRSKVIARIFVASHVHSWPGLVCVCLTCTYHRVLANE